MFYSGDEDYSTEDLEGDYYLPCGCWSGQRDHTCEFDEDDEAEYHEDVSWFDNYDAYPDDVDLTSDQVAASSAWGQENDHIFAPADLHPPF